MSGRDVIPLPHIYGARIKGTEVFCPLDPPPPYEHVVNQIGSEQVCFGGVSKCHLSVCCKSKISSSPWRLSPSWASWEKTMLAWRKDQGMQQNVILESCRAAFLLCFCSVSVLHLSTSKSTIFTDPFLLLFWRRYFFFLLKLLSRMKLAELDGNDWLIEIH